MLVGWFAPEGDKGPPHCEYTEVTESLLYGLRPNRCFRYPSTVHFPANELRIHVVIFISHWAPIDALYSMSLKRET